MEGIYYGRIPVYPHEANCEAVLNVFLTEEAENARVASASLFEAECGVDPALTWDLSQFHKAGAVDEYNRMAYGVACEFYRYCKRNMAIPPDGFTLFGQQGAGKTTLQAALARSLCRLGVRCLWVDLPELRLKLASKMTDGSLAEWMNRLSNPRIQVLFLDQMGQEDPSTHWVVEFIGPTIDRRTRRNLPIIGATIHTLDKLRDERWGAWNSSFDGAKSIVDRLGQKSGWVSMDGPSRRTPKWSFLSPSGAKK